MKPDRRGTALGFLSVLHLWRPALGSDCSSFCSASPRRFPILNWYQLTATGRATRTTLMAAYNLRGPRRNQTIVVRISPLWGRRSIINLKPRAAPGGFAAGLSNLAPMAVTRHRFGFFGAAFPFAAPSPIVCSATLHTPCATASSHWAVNTSPAWIVRGESWCVPLRCTHPTGWSGGKQSEKSRDVPSSLRHEARRDVEQRASRYARSTSLHASRDPRGIWRAGQIGRASCRERV